jgi:hypothetical protein
MCHAGVTLANPKEEPLSKNVSLAAVFSGSRKRVSHASSVCSGTGHQRRSDSCGAGMRHRILSRIVGRLSTESEPLLAVLLGPDPPGVHAELPLDCRGGSE